MFLFSYFMFEFKNKLYDKSNFKSYEIKAHANLFF